MVWLCLFRRCDHDPHRERISAPQPCQEIGLHEPPAASKLRGWDIGAFRALAMRVGHTGTVPLQSGPLTPARNRSRQQSDLMKRGLSGTIAFDKIQAPYVSNTRSSPGALLVLGDVRPEVRLHVAPATDAVAGHAAWPEVARFEDEVTGVAPLSDDL